MPATDARASRAKRPAVALVALVLALACGELGLRALGRAVPEPTYYVGEFEDRPSANFASDPDTGWRMHGNHVFTRNADGVPITYRSDANGFRTGDDAPAPLRSQLVALVGDSQTWGFGVPFEQTFGALLGLDLGGVRVANLAQPGFGLDQIGLALRHQALPLQPDLVVVAVFKDDFNRSLQAYRTVEGMNKPTFVLEDGALRRRTADDRPGALVRFLERHSHLYQLARRTLRDAGLVAPDETWLELNTALLDAMRADAEAAGVPVVFLRIPSEPGTTFEAFDAWARRTGAPYIDPARTPPDEGELYLPDRHLNGAGHRWVADCILRWIEEHLPELLTQGG